MSSASPLDAKELVRQAVDIVDLVGESYELRRQGRNYVCRCPWHDDTRPSLTVNQERQSWKCWVCDIGGDIFSWVMRRDGIEFREALEMLAERAGIDIHEGIEIYNARLSSRNADYADYLYSRLQRRGYLFRDCQ
ncbi:MAG: hypothetical protein KDA37_08860, partial [Planctomycetales bacterium]|nr:hypothetical protein [Planctomycetales bacterium]